MLNTPPLSALRDLALRLAVAAGEELLARLPSLSIDDAGVETKTSASDPVSDADRASEKLITDGLSEARPGDGLLGEEGAARRSATGLTWVIDPLDARQVELAKALVSTGFSYLPERRAEQAEYLRLVLPAVRDVRRGGSAALDLCSIADGTADAYYEHVIQSWDIAAGALIAREAGAEVLALQQGVLAASPRLAAALIELLTPRRLV